MKRNLLFVTHHDENCEEGLSYAIDLAKIMNESITILLVYKQKLMKRFEDIMTAVTFAEAGEHETAKRIMLDSDEEADKSDNKLNLLIEKCRKSGIDVNVQTATINIVSAIEIILSTQKAGIDMILLSPSVIDNGNVSAKELNRLVRTASRPVVTMARQAYAV